MTTAAYNATIRQLSADYRQARRDGNHTLAASILERQRDLLRHRYELTRQR